jgi:hypothetical protein
VSANPYHRPSRLRPAYAQYLQLSGHLAACGRRRAEAFGQCRHIFTPAEKFVLSVEDSWALVRCPDGGFLLLFETGFTGKFGAGLFDFIGLPRIAEIYRRAERLLPRGYRSRGRALRRKLPAPIRDQLAALTDEIRHADEEIAQAVVQFLQRLASLSHNPRDPEVPSIYYLVENPWVELN